jgi:carboxylesterase
VDVDVSPFDLNPTERRAVLLLHGFTGTPYEMRGLGLALAARGLRAVGPLLPGHGDSAALLNATGWNDWRADVERAFVELRPAAVVGFSMGGCLALELARAHPELAALCVLGAPLWLPWTTRLGARALARVIDFVPKMTGSDIQDRAARATFPALARFPLAALGSLMTALPSVRAGVSEITVPTLIVHAWNDHVAPFACALELHEKIGATDRRLVPLPRSYHVVTVDIERDRVAREVVDFITQRIG